MVVTVTAEQIKMENRRITVWSSFMLILTMYSYATLPVRISPAVVTGPEDGVCPSNNLIEAQLNVTKQQVKQAVASTINPFLDSGCGGSGWRRVAYLNMSDPTATCPSSWTLHSSPRGCGRTLRDAFTCDSTVFPANGVSYSSVCGRILAYQRGSTDAFYNSLNLGRTSIDSAYVDGISVTHGPVSSRQHIWTFASALYEENPSYTTVYTCACTNTQYNWPHQLPSFVQNNYFCDTGNPGPGISFTDYYTTDPLWDGAGCGPNNTCCQLNNPPWFQSTLPQGTSDDIELRLCRGESNSDGEDTIVYLIEIYVQ